MAKRTIEQYEIVRRLGAGGSGVVYLATDTLLQRPVVLKILRTGVMSAEKGRATMLREARLASAIEHPNVCAIYEVGESGGEAYIVMQYVPGQSLDQLIARGPARPQLVLSVGIQVADGLQAAHALGIFHRDLKPQNVMLTEGGLAKILDFGLARRLRPEDATFDPAKPALAKEAKLAATYTARGGTIRYMAPEQFVTGHSSVQSDIWALGVILYELVSGRYPFARPDAEDFQAIRSIQFADPPDLAEAAPNIPAELRSVILTCLEKNPSARYTSAAEVREALKTIMKALQIETGSIPGDAAANLPTTDAEAEKRNTGLLSMLAERFRESAGDRPHPNSLVVLPFANLGASEVAPLYGYALADAIAARLARIPGLVVRPTSTLMALPVAQMDPLQVGQRLLVSFVLAGSFLRSQHGFDLNWQLLEVGSQSVRSGGAIQVTSLDLIAVQNEISTEVFAALHGLSANEQIDAPRSVAREASLPGLVSEEYLQARALLSSFMVRTGSRADLDRAHALFTSVTSKDPEFAAGWSGLGIAELQYTRHGFAGQSHIMLARRAFDQALKLDPAATEPNLYRVYMLLSRGEKESARHGILNLLSIAENDWNVHMVAGLALRGDGMYDEALAQFNRALKLNPANAAILYNHRARVYHYQNQLELAGDELDKGLALEPRHPLLRTSSGYQQMRLGNIGAAIDILESVIRDDQFLRIAVPTLAICYVSAGERAQAAALLKDETLAAAEADSEMAYRLATYFAVEGDATEALHWLRRAIYLGNENYPWFQKNPAWNNFRTNADFDRILEDLKKSFRKNQKTWKRLLEQVPREPE
ncbi:serine/threonine-protein kinase [Occallatibacter riparius]|uniref:Protein kinase n=1 Tax=Occallatibacter riparius TaxID=1002689 RepID=A0A9J7BVW1_9BACT|nr:serine/threonine-protein kinase [Occallatibacter riparius]UWZ86665.1 protein kinase [Occallatibacter riparius]